MNKYQEKFNIIVDAIRDYVSYREFDSLPSENEIYGAMALLRKLLNKAESFEWIPVSEGLPKEHDSIFAKLYGTDKWTSALWRTTSNIVIATIKYNDGTVIVKEAFTHDGEWTVEKRNTNCKVIAWMPLPKPYEEKENGRY